MSKKAKKHTPPTCTKCGMISRLTNGEEIYQHRPDLYAKNFYICDCCGGYVGCHGATTKPLGTPADAELRNARNHVHKVLDPIWQSAADSGAYGPKDQKAAFIISRAARGRVYTYLAHHMGIEKELCHTGMFNIEDCRAAWKILHGLSYVTVRDWYKTNFPKKEAA